MRVRRLFPWLALAAVLLAGGFWLRERVAAAALQDRFTALARQQQELARLQAGRDQLNRELQAALAQARDERVTPTVRPAESPESSPVWNAGEWTPAGAWSNEGRATPRAAIATLLWAAAGGDLAALRGMLDFNAAASAKARALFDRLPPAERASYGTPEDFFTAATLYQVPQTRAQLSWLHQADADHAIVGLLLATPASATPLPPLDYQPAANGAPPMLKGTSPYAVVVLNLSRASDGWHVNVPTTAIDNLARRLRAPGAEAGSPPGGP